MWILALPFLVSGQITSSTFQDAKLSAEVWNCLGYITKHSNCPTLIPGEEVFFEGIGAMDNLNAYTMSFTTTCVRSYQRPTFVNYTWQTDIDPLMCPQACEYAGYSCPFRMPVPNATCNGYETGYSGCLYSQTSGVWMSAFSLNNVARLWQTRIDTLPGMLSGAPVICTDPDYMYVVGSTIVLQCRLTQPATGYQLASSLLFGVDKTTGAVRWQQVLPVGPILGGVPAWNQTSPAQRGTSTFVLKTFPSGGTYLSSSWIHVTDYDSPRVCAEACLNVPECTTWNLRRERDEDWCRMWSGPATLAPTTGTSAYDDTDFMSGKILTPNSDRSCAISPRTRQDKPLLLIDQKSNSVFVPDPMSTGFIQYDIATGNSIRSFPLPVWSRQQNMYWTECTGAVEFAPARVEPMLVSLPNMTLMIGLRADNMTSLTATNIQTGATVWDFDMPLAIQYPHFVGVGGTILYWTAFWNYTKCNLVTFNVTTGGLVYLNRLLLDNACSDYSGYYMNIEPATGRFFLMTQSTSIYFDPAQQKLVTASLASAVSSSSFKAFIANSIIARIADNDQSVFIYLLSPFTGTFYASVELPQLATENDFITVVPSQGLAHIMSSPNSSRMVALVNDGFGASRVMVYHAESNKVIKVSEASAIAIVVLTVVGGVSQLIICCLKRRKKDDDEVMKRFDIFLILWGAVISLIVIVITYVQQDEIYGLIKAWRGDFSLSSFDTFATAHISSFNGRPNPSDVCTCDTGPCSSKDFVESCGLSSYRPTCTSVLSQFSACDLSLHGYTCECAVTLTGCDIILNPGTNASYVPSASNGFNQCIAHYDSLASEVLRVMNGMLAVGIVQLVFDACRVAVIVITADSKSTVLKGFGWMSFVMTIIGTITESVLISQLSGLNVGAACAGPGGFLVSELPGCSLTNIGGLTEAEQALNNRIAQCISLFIANPIYMGLMSLFIVFQEWFRLPCCS